MKTRRRQHGEFILYRYISAESFSQFDSLPLTSLTIRVEAPSGTSPAHADAADAAASVLASAPGEVEENAQAPKEGLQSIMTMRGMRGVHFMHAAEAPTTGTGELGTPKPVGIESGSAWFISFVCSSILLFANLFFCLLYSFVFFALFKRPGECMGCERNTPRGAKPRRGALAPPRDR